MTIKVYRGYRNGESRRSARSSVRINNSCNVNDVQQALNGSQDLVWLEHNLERQQERAGVEVEPVIASTSPRQALRTTTS